MTATQTFLTLTDNLLTLSGLQSAANLAYLNAATVSVVLTDKDSGLQIGGQSWPLVLNYSAGSNGVYQAILINGLVTTVGQRLLATITATDAGSGLQRVFVLPCQVELG